MEGTKFPGSPFPMPQDIGWSPDCFFCEEAVISLLLLLSSIIVIVISANNCDLLELPILQKDLFLNALQVVLFHFQLLAFVF